MFDSVLVANRGEIAVRIIRTLRRLGIRSVAVYSDADVCSPHVRLADSAVRIGPAPAIDSYLRVDRIVEAAVSVGADAIHPGYGFLSENAALVEACTAANTVFVGPSGAAIEAMGDKIRAKATVAAAGVRVVPGSEESGLSDAALAEAATAVGFPVLIKPSAGGGGKGMHLVREASELAGAIASARREATGAFGNDDLLVERYVERPRHIEIQVLADAHGNVVHLGERECSLQRRHQKIVEEAPSPYLTDERRASLGEQAVASARACAYVNAGTVEFIVSGVDAGRSGPADAFFMEMNTRLQVEHPVTEMVWGLDLVEWQLRVAAGEPLGFAQADLAPSGHAIEARIYGEDPRRVLPSGGQVLALSEAAGEGVRVDSGLAIGVDVGGSYDPMLAKVIAWGADRAIALRRLDRALAGTVVLGVTTNVAFLRRLLSHPDVAAGRLDTGLVERELDSLVDHDVPGEVAVAAALSERLPRSPAADPWAVSGGWRVGARGWSVWNADVAGREVRVAVRGTGEAMQVRVDDGDPVEVHARWDADDLVVGDGRSMSRFQVARTGGAVWLGRDGVSWMFVEQDAVRTGHGSAGGTATGAVRSPMPGTVVAVSVALGDTVETGRPLVVVEAMKMEHTVVAPTAGSVAELPVTVGQKVALDQLLARIAPAATAPAQ